MADTQDNNQQQNSKPTFDPFRDNRNTTGDPIADAMQNLADAINNHPDIFQGGRNATRESQSNYSTNSKWTIGRNRRNAFRSTGSILSDVEEGFKDALLDAIAGGDFKKGLQGALSAFTDKFGFELKELPQRYGQYLGKQLLSTKVGQAFSKKLSDAASSFIGRVFGKENAAGLIDAFKNAAGGIVGQGGASGGQALAQEQLFTNIGKFLKGAGGIAAAVAIFVIAMKPVFEGFTAWVKSFTSAFNRDEDMRRKRLKNAQDRMQKDMEILVKQPFEILQKAAEEWEQTWDQNLSKISLTQGYTKEGVYDLYSAIAEELKNEGLEKVIPATDVVNNLSKIIDSGLSGVVAQAFALESTKLSAAIPTEDFTSYAGLYAQLASEAMNQNLPRADAIAYANSQLEEFASNLLYSSRTLAGGFTTGLKDSQSLFKDAIEIAQTAKTYNASEISGTLTSVSAIIGSVAPDLAQGLVQNIVSAAIGGNNSTIVALRSLAGINAGNTDFLRQMALDPQGVFVTIFRNLAQLQDMSPTNYMEVAEGLSQVFGVDMKAFARVNFNTLADKISDMVVNQYSLAENMELLRRGEATVTADQLRYQEINNDILNNGLAYVIDSEYGRMIQQHMWDEQLANELQENEYSVNIKGAALEFLEGLRHTVANILAFINPVGYVADGIARIIASNEETNYNNERIADLLENGKVGDNLEAFSNLTNVSGTPLNLTNKKNLTDFFGSRNYNPSATGIGNNAITEAISGIAFGTAPFSLGILAANYGARHFGWFGGNQIPTSAAGWNAGVDSLGGVTAVFGGNTGGGRSPSYVNVSGNRGPQSLYSGFAVGKNALALLGGSPSSYVATSPMLAATNANADAMLKASKESVDAYLASMENFDFTKQSMAEFYKTSTNFGIPTEEVLDALADYGVTEEDLNNYAQTRRSQAGQEVEESRKKNIQAFIEENRGFWDYSNGIGGVFQTAMWLPFFGDNRKYDTRMDAVDVALTEIQNRIGNANEHTVISGIEELSRKLGDDTDFTVISVLSAINNNIENTFVSTTSAFQKCLADWIRYIAEANSYTDTVSKSQAWNDYRNAERDQQTEATLALAQALQVFSAEELQKMDPQLQTNALLGEIVIILQAIMQQTNTPGGLNLIDTISALGLGMTK